VVVKKESLHQKYIDWDSFKKEGQRYQEHIEKLKNSNLKLKEMFKKKTIELKESNKKTKKTFGDIVIKLRKELETSEEQHKTEMD
jgi:outer membrane translocation and assembly module TamA